MNKHEIIRYMKRFPDRIITAKEAETDMRLRSKKWKCSICGVLYRFDVAVRNPAPCKECDSIFFEVLK